MAEDARSLRAWVAQTRLTVGRVTGGLVLELGRRFDFALPPLRVIRPADLLVLEFRFVNFRRDGARLVRSDPDKPAYLIVIHQPQSFGEEAFHEIQDQEDFATDPALDGLVGPAPVPPRDPDPIISEGIDEQAEIRIARPSRVAYKMPAEVDGIDRNLEALLRACRKWPLSLDGNAQSDPGDFHFEGSIDLGWVATFLQDVSATVWTALEASLGLKERRALDEIAAGLADEALAANGAGRDAEGRALRSRVDIGIRRIIPARGDDEAVRVDQVLAAIYVRAQASREAVTRVESASARDRFELSRLPPDIFINFLDPHPPSDRETAIEMPYRLFASPLASAGFAHALAPVTHRNRTELWHSRLGSRVMRNGQLQIDDRPGVPTESGGWDGEKLRFLWSPDYPVPSPISGFTQPLDELDRRMLVELTAGFNALRQDGQTPFVPRAVFVRRLMLTAMGGDLEAHRKFDPRPQNVDLSAWTHRSTIGRDSFVRVEYSGFLFPFGHRATLVKLTERKFQWRAPADRVAALRQRFFIIVRDKMIAYPGMPPQPNEGRTFPFEQVICALEGATPDLDIPGNDPGDRVDTGAPDVAAERRKAFWPSRGGGVDYKFPLVGIDGAGRKIAFEMPLMFISELKNTAGAIPFIQADWNGPGKPATRRVASLAGQIVRMAPATNGSAVDIPLIESEIRAINPTTDLSTTPGQTLQQFPRFGEAKAKLAAIERLTGVARVETIKYLEAYRLGGFKAGAVFAEIVGAAKLGFGSDTPSSSVGGIATPDLTPSGLSASHGVTSGNLTTFNGGEFDPQTFFPDDAKLLGFFSLKTLLHKVTLNGPGGEPKITTVEESDHIRTTFSITQTLGSGEPVPGLILGAGGEESEFTLEALVDSPLTGGAPETSVTGTLTHFKISFLGALIIHFDRLRFFTRPGAKPDVDVDLNPQTGVTFGGPLEFINRLKDFIPANGFSDPPNLDVTPAGITAGYSLGLPAIQVGILSLSNISLGAAFSLPFTGDPPTARFNFAERQNTFNLTVSMFGGGGFVALVAATDGIKEIEAQLDFGAQIAINLGVASGSVYVKGGFYFHYAADMIEFEGFVELGGRLSVLGLISVSLTFHLGLTYELLQKSANNGIRASRLFGQATLTVEIEILFFSASVDVTVEKTFVGSEADPTFLDLVPQKALWDEYCAAYA